jgi:hypothetical protein
MKKNIFCANCQEITPHVVVISNDEYVFTCDCGRFIKFPSSLSKEDLIKAIAKHEEVNKGQLTVEALEKELKEKLSALDELTEE